MHGVDRHGHQGAHSDEVDAKGPPSGIARTGDGGVERRPRAAGRAGDVVRRTEGELELFGQRLLPRGVAELAVRGLGSEARHSAGTTEQGDTGNG